MYYVHTSSLPIHNNQDSSNLVSFWAYPSDNLFTIRQGVAYTHIQNQHIAKYTKPSSSLPICTTKYMSRSNNTRVWLYIDMCNMTISIFKSKYVPKFNTHISATWQFMFFYVYHNTLWWVQYTNLSHLGKMQMQDSNILRLEQIKIQHGNTNALVTH